MAKNQGRASKQKGARGELEVCGLVSNWWSAFEPGVSFKRTPLSGGWAGGGEFGVSGDLVTTSKLFPFSVEVKWRENVVFDRFFRGFRSPVWGWWAQCQEAAEKMSAEPMLWARKSRTPWVVLIGREFAQKLGITTDHPPDYVLNEFELRARAIKFGQMPVVYYAERLLELPPSAFLHRGSLKH